MPFFTLQIRQCDRSRTPPSPRSGVARLRKRPRAGSCDLASYRAPSRKAFASASGPLASTALGGAAAPGRELSESVWVRVSTCRLRLLYGTNVNSQITQFKSDPFCKRRQQVGIGLILILIKYMINYIVYYYMFLYLEVPMCHMVLKFRCVTWYSYYALGYN